MRLFLALWPSAAERRTLESLAAGCRAPWRPMPAAGLHLTVAFLGELPCARLPWLAAVLARQGSRPPPVVLDRLETWGDGRWRCAVGTATPSLRAWQGRVAATLAAGGLRLERRAFVPHVTLARWAGAGRRGDRAMADAQAALPQAIRPATRLAAARLVLVESRPAGVRYRVLMEAGRADPPPA